MIHEFEGAIQDAGFAIVQGMMNARDREDDRRTKGWLVYYEQVKRNTTIAGLRSAVENARALIIAGNAERRVLEDEIEGLESENDQLRAQLARLRGRTIP